MRRGRATKEAKGGKRWIRGERKVLRFFHPSINVSRLRPDWELPYVRHQLDASQEIGIVKNPCLGCGMDLYCILPRECTMKI